ncbi:MAG: 50S ribosomal protein L29 [Candidatus Bathyarchaeota archaeon B26-2]|nr:MAG: 50S ribosomal protein L29 [Candidatus Bathyarchaeota archaeon B26-2]
MPILRMREIREMSVEERERRLADLKAELIRLRTMVKAGGTIENPSRIREIRKTIARILTVNNEERMKKR